MNAKVRQGESRRRVLLALIVAAYYAVCCHFPQWMALLGVDHLGVWFLDTRAVLAASDAHALGIPPDALNPLDFLHQPHAYSTWWFGLHQLQLTREDYVWVGALLGFVFLIVALFQVQVRSLGEVAWSAALLCAPPIVLGFNRGNADLLIFLLLSIAAAGLCSARSALRWLAVILIVAAAGLKYYPAVALLLLVVRRRSVKETMAQLAFAAISLLAVIYAEAAGFEHYAQEPSPFGFFTFGMEITPRLNGASPWMAHGIALGTAIFAVICWWRFGSSPPKSSGHAKEHLHFLLGALVMTGCYFTTVNFSYRLVCTIWIGPYLWRAWSDADAPQSYRWTARVAAVLLTLLLWLDGLVCLGINLSHRFSASEVDLWTRRLVVAEQPYVFALVIALLGLSVPPLRDAARDLWRRLRIPAIQPEEPARDYSG